MAMKDAQIAIVGGGIAGLVAAAALARRGLRPTLFEAAPDIGGRAQTRTLDDFHFNQGPHAIYPRGALNRELRSLGLSVPGHAPRVQDGLAVWGAEAHALPVRPTAGRAAAPLDRSDTACLADTFARIAAGECGASGAPLRAFTGALPTKVAAVIEALVRVSSYTHAPEHIDGKAALDQLRLSFSGVVYVDGGWRELTSQLADAATAGGAVLQREHAVVAIHRVRQGWQVEVAGQAPAPFEAVVLAVPPAAARGLLPGSAHIAAGAGAAQPVRASCLDLGLASIADAVTDFALGMEAPTYLSLHSAVAQLAPPGQGLLHLARYLAPDEAPRAAHFEELEHLADRLRPGWRDSVAHRQRLIGLTVAHDYPRWRRGGGRTAVVVADAPGAFLAGDWVGDEGMLSDAAAASAVLAAREAAAFIAGVPA
jgi:phytoene dehydrogenase-like protein